MNRLQKKQPDIAAKRSIQASVPYIYMYTYILGSKAYPNITFIC